MLTDKEARAAAPKKTSYRLADEKGLHLEVTPAGSELWRYRYEAPQGEARKEKMLALGRLPDVGLAAARGTPPGHCWTRARTRAWSAGSSAPRPRW